MKKGIFKRVKQIVSCSLIIAMMATMLGQELHQQVAQAKTQTSYISEVKLAYDDDADVAKKKLTDAGYQIYDRDLNQKTKKKFVFMGYKTTTDPEKAITDIKAMEQDNGYNLYDLKSVMDGMKDDALTDANGVMAVVEEFRKNFKADESRANDAYNLMQQYKYSDSQQLGDYIIKDATKMNLTEVILYSAPTTFNGLMEALGVGVYCKESKTWLTKLGKDIPKYEVDSVLKSKARKILSAIKSFGVAMDKEEELQNQIEKAKTEEEKNVLLEESQDIALVTAMITLDKYNYKGESILKYILKDDLTADKLYDFAAVMEAYDMALLAQLGLSGLCAVSDNIKLDADQKVVVEKQEKKDDVEYDFWAGSLKTDYKSIALTNETVRDITVGEEDTIVPGVSNALLIGTSVAGGIAMISVASTAYLWTRYVNATKVQSALNKIAKLLEWRVGTGSIAGRVAELEDFGRYFTKTALGRKLAPSEYLTWSAKTRNIIETGKLSKSLNGGSEMAKLRATAAARSGLRLKAICGTVMTVAMIALVGALITISIKEYLNPDYSVRPERMVSLETNEDGEDTYVSYDAVLDGDRISDVADTNAYQGQKWCALYVTKDKTMGTPIKADTFTDESGNGMTAISFLGRTDAADLNKNVYNHDTSVYVYYEKANENTLASIFTTTNMVVLVIILLAIIAVGGVLVVRKKKKKVA